MKTSKTLTDEFVNCGKKLIHLANDGVIKTRVKGSLKDEVRQLRTLPATRQTVDLKRAGPGHPLHLSCRGVSRADPFEVDMLFGRGLCLKLLAG
eukprot:245820-Pyramimonas_sp.AAC.2